MDFYFSWGGSRGSVAEIVGSVRVNAKKGDLKEGALVVVVGGIGRGGWNGRRVDDVKARTECISG
jgi:hypothetical protein